MSSEVADSARTTFVRAGFDVEKVNLSDTYALKIRNAPGRFGKLVRRTERMASSPVSVVYDPVRALIEGGSGFYDASTNSIHLDNALVKNAAAGITSPIGHEYRHSTTAQRLAANDGANPYPGKLFFGKAAAPRYVSQDYRDQFDMDEVYTYFKQSKQTTAEFSRAIRQVQELGLDEALKDRRTKLMYTQGREIANEESRTSRAFARAVREHVNDMAANIESNITHVRRATLHLGGGPATQAYIFSNSNSRDMAQVDYWVDENRRVKVAVVRQAYDAAGVEVPESHRIALLDFGKATDKEVYPGHAEVIRRLRQAGAEADMMIKRAVDHEVRIEELESLRDKAQAAAKQAVPPPRTRMPRGVLAGFAGLLSIIAGPISFFADLKESKDPAKVRQVADAVQRGEILFESLYLSPLYEPVRQELRRRFFNTSDA